MSYIGRRTTAFIRNICPRGAIGTAHDSYYLFNSNRAIAGSSPAGGFISFLLFGGWVMYICLFEGSLVSNCLPVPIVRVGEAPYQLSDRPIGCISSMHKISLHLHTTVINENAARSLRPRRSLSQRASTAFLNETLYLNIMHTISNEDYGYYRPCTSILTQMQT